MTMLAIDAAVVTTEARGAALHEALLAEARGTLGRILSGPSTPEEVAEVLDEVGGGELDEPTLAVLSDVLAG
jgi:hypothetical protein